MPLAEVRSRTASRKPGSGGMTPVLHRIGSQMTAAIRSRRGPVEQPRRGRPRSFQRRMATWSAEEASWPRLGRWGVGVVIRPVVVERRRDAGEDRVQPAVVVPLELDDDVAPGRGPGEAEGRLDHLGPGAAEADPLGARARSTRTARPARPRPSSGRRTAGRDPPGRVHRPTRPEPGAWPRMAGPMPEHVVHVVVAVDVDEVRAGASLEEQRDGIAAGAEVAADATGQRATRPLERRGFEFA